MTAEALGQASKQRLIHQFADIFKVQGHMFMFTLNSLNSFFWDARDDPFDQMWAPYTMLRQVPRGAQADLVFYRPPTCNEALSVWPMWRLGASSPASSRVRSVTIP